MTRLKASSAKSHHHHAKTAKTTKTAKDPITAVADSVAHRAEEAKDHGSSIFQLVICVGGIYASL